MSSSGIENGSFLTVIDEDDDEPFVNVVISVQQRFADDQATLPTNRTS
jgi:hypothetical protein